MKKISLLHAFLFLAFSFSFGSKHRYNSIASDFLMGSSFAPQQSKSTSDSSILNYQNFLLLQKYIRENGSIEKVNISSQITKPIYITYHILKFNEWQLTVDHSKRIYCSVSPSKLHVGNILVDENNKVLLETETNENSKRIKMMLEQLFFLLHKRP